MRTFARQFGFAFAAWVVPFAASVCVYPLKSEHRPFFEMIMSLVLTANTAFLAVVYLRRVAGRHLLHAARVGLIWMLANWLLDLLMFTSGPMQMSFRQYAADIAGAYFVIPVITTAIGVAALPKRSNCR